jgi:L-seryl-tRNA(Ser) seleniumtransferase
MTQINEGKETPFRRLPAVEKLLNSNEIKPLVGRYSHQIVTEAIQQVLDSLRSAIRQGPQMLPIEDDFPRLVSGWLSRKWPGFMSPVINATGIVLHTNLGRAPLSHQSLEAVCSLGGGYINLETDLDTGERGARIFELRRLLSMTTGAEDALVVNNNAAAVLLVLVCLGHAGEAIVSRGELVQIGGGFRVPEIMEQSGVVLREVGTTNQTYAGDYERAINNKTALILKVHPSNFTQRGFVHEASMAELARISQKNNIPLVYDLGSGAMVDAAEFGLAHEPMVQEALRDGGDIICFSGDKLLGGPQSGIIVGKKKYIQKFLKHPLLRVVRIDKLSAIALEATIRHYLNPEPTREIPIWQMMSLTKDDIENRVDLVVGMLKASGIDAGKKDGLSLVGGGSLPGEGISTVLIKLKPPGKLDSFCRRLRMSDPPLLSRIDEGSVILDLRTVLPEQDVLISPIVTGAWPTGGQQC